MSEGQVFSKDRRRWMAGGVALAAAAGGAWVGWSQLEGATGNEEAIAAFWGLQLAQPDGAPLNLASLRGKPLLVNFWATWCPPCVRELPMINRFAQEQAARGAHAIQVLGIAVDQAAAVNKWLARQPLDFPVVLAGAGGVTLTRSLGNINGGLPFTILLDAKGKAQQRKIGELSQQDLEQWAAWT
ncbi:TlpA disulfide reductase family protein [Comamonas sp. CMM02]|jgi:thiol-disulfide isomerase/thioredoxin|uniref:TlpA family protein disulfide reductase n=1 Tax=Comamonas sp. CMM02 TaxID=2769307 RepID=UPI0017824A77|nr:TlpA disulfide reductase family protein [Comamonas sp. CMM02]MBD9401506.1 TlpA family protein disulfide reductase [Comamonas sp. CMM02]